MKFRQLLALGILLLAAPLFAQTNDVQSRVTNTPAFIAAGPTTNMTQSAIFDLRNYSKAPLGIELTFNSQIATTNGILTAFIAGSADGTYFEQFSPQNFVSGNVCGTNQVRTIKTVDAPWMRYLKVGPWTSTSTNICTNIIVRALDGGNARK